MAPEIFNKNGYDEKCDLWSLGISIYQLFFNEFPINKKSIQFKDCLKKTNDGELDDLIEKLLVEDPEKRISWEEYFHHPFFIKKEKIVKKLDKKDFSPVFRLIENKMNIKEKNIKIDDLYENKINIFKEEHQKNHFSQLPIYASKQEEKIGYKNNCSINLKNHIIPIIIIDEKEYNNFMKILPYFKGYDKFKNINILNTKYILSYKKINKINHINKNIFFAEWSFSLNPYSNEENIKYENELKVILDANNKLIDFIEEWVRVLFNLMTEYILFVLNKNPLYFICKKLPNLYFQDNKNEIKGINEDIKNISIDILFV